MEYKEIMLVGLDIYELVKNLCDQLLCRCESPDMTEGEKKAFRLGVNNVLSLLDQILNVNINEGGEEYHNVAVHIRGLEKDLMTEIADMEELEKEIRKLETE